MYITWLCWQAEVMQKSLQSTAGLTRPALWHAWAAVHGKKTTCCNATGRRGEFGRFCRSCYAENRWRISRGSWGNAAIIGHWGILARLSRPKCGIRYIQEKAREPACCCDGNEGCCCKLESIQSCGCFGLSGQVCRLGWWGGTWKREEPEAVWRQESQHGWRRSGGRNEISGGAPEEKLGWASVDVQGPQPVSVSTAKIERQITITQKSRMLQLRAGGSFCEGLSTWLPLLQLG